MTSASVTLDSSGNGTAQAGPSFPGESWLPGVVSVGSAESSVTNEATCKIFIGPSPAQNFYVDGTLSGSTGDSTANVTGQAVFPGNYIFAVWSGGDAGARATMNIQGTRNVPGSD